MIQFSNNNVYYLIRDDSRHDKNQCQLFFFFSETWSSATPDTFLLRQNYTIILGKLVSRARES